MSRRKMTFNTIKIPVEYTSTGDKDMIISYQRQQTHIVRSVYKKEEKKQEEKKLEKINKVDIIVSVLRMLRVPGAALSPINYGRWLYEFCRERVSPETYDSIVRELNSSISKEGCTFGKDYDSFS